jgi:tetratricopeptide (TPR) repeat protein
MISKEMSQVLTYYNLGLSLYKERKFKEALIEFTKCIEVLPNDGPSLMYIHRCKEFIDSPPSDDWDGVYIMKTK